MKHLRITARAEKRLKSGHLWIYSNEFDTQFAPLKEIENGEQVAVENPQGRIIAYAFINPQALICGRIVSRKRPFDRTVLKKLLRDALVLREQAFTKPFYRLFYAEGDYLPGLIIDRYGDCCVVQINNLGLEAFRDDIAELLISITEGQGVLFRNDAAKRTENGLIDADNVAYGEVAEWVDIEENGCAFSIPVQQGQKTGWFYDHRDNRAKVAALSEGKRVLDVFSYIGGWGVQCLQAGAAHLTAIDASEFALETVHKNAALIGREDDVETLMGNAFDALQALLEEKEKFDVVILDPPAFIKKKKDFNRGIQAYKKINELALRLASAQGIFVSASCSMHLADEDLQELVQKSARHVDRNLSLIYRGGHAADHPIHPAIKETEYLKAQIYKLRQ